MMGTDEHTKKTFLLGKRSSIRSTRTHHFLHKIKLGSHRAKIKVSTGCLPFWRLWWRICFPAFFSFQMPPTFLGLSPLPPFLSSQPAMADQVLPSQHITLTTLLSPASTSKNVYDDIGLNWIIQSNLPILRSANQQAELPFVM